MEFKVLRIINRFNVGGISYNVAYLSKYLSSSFTTKVIGGIQETYEEGSYYVFNNLELEHTVVDSMQRKINPLNDLKSILKIFQYILDYEPRIIHTHASKAGMVGRLAKMLIPFNDSKVVHTFHGNVFDGYFTGLKRKFIINSERFLARHTDAIVAISESQKDDLINKYRICKAEKVHVIPLGFDLERFEQIDFENRKRFREEFGVNEATIVLTIVGRLVPIKNHSLFIDIVSMLKSKVSIDIKSFIVGDGDIKSDLIHYARSKSLKTNFDCDYTDSDIVFTSWRKDLPDIYAGSDFIILTSLNEGTPVSIIEAMASKKIVLSTNVGGVSDILDPDSGFICDHIPEQFVSVIEELLMNRKKMKSIGENAFNQVIKKYHYKRLCSDMEALYFKLLNK